MDDTIDLLKIKIEKAKAELPIDTQNAIAAVDWKATIFGLRDKYGYTFEQLGDLELETELLLCGLARIEDYPKELSKQMGISNAAANDLVNEMNNLVFKKIREELIKNTERKRIFANKRKEIEEEKIDISDMKVLNSTGIEIIGEKETLPAIEKLELGTTEKPTEDNREDILKKIETVPPVRSRPLENESAAVTLRQPASNGIHPILAQKFSGSLQMPIVKTEHTLEKITKTSVPVSTNVKPKIPNIDPYREIPE